MIRKKIIYLTVAISAFSLTIQYSPKSYGQNIFKTIKGAFDSNHKEAKSKSNDKDKKSKSEDIYDLTLDENIENPPLGKYTEEIKVFQRKQAVRLKKEKYNTELTREGEVIVITIPAADLFMPNDTVLSAEGIKLLIPLLRFLKTPDNYRMLMNMHTDNTGTKDFTFNLSRQRVEAIFDWFETQNVNTDFIIPYAAGLSQPLRPNNSMDNRIINRRLEIYLVPGKAMIENAKKSTLQL